MWSRSAGDRAILYSWDEGKSIVLNPTGAVLWESLESPRTASELVDVLVGRFPGLQTEHARVDVARFVERLVGEGVLRSDPRASSGVE